MKSSVMWHITKFETFPPHVFLVYASLGPLVMRFASIPAKHFTCLEPQNPLIDVSGLHKIRRSMSFEAQNCSDFSSMHYSSYSTHNVQNASFTQWEVEEEGWMDGRTVTGSFFVVIAKRQTGLSRLHVK